MAWPPCRFLRIAGTALLRDPWTWLGAGGAGGSAGRVSHQIWGCTSPLTPGQILPGAASSEGTQQEHLGDISSLSPHSGDGAGAAVGWPRGSASSPAPEQEAPALPAVSIEEPGTKGLFLRLCLCRGDSGSGTGTVAAGDRRVQGSGKELAAGWKEGMQGLFVSLDPLLYVLEIPNYYKLYEVCLSMWES